MVLGLRRPFTGAWLFGPVVGVAIYVGVLVAFAWLLVVTWRRRERYAEPLVAAAVAYPFLFALSPTSYYTDEPRYGLMLAPVVVLLIVRVLTTPWSRIAALGFAIVLATGTAMFIDDVAASHPYSADVAPPDVAGLERELRVLGVDRVYGDYWIVYPLTFESQEDIIGSPVDAVRNASYADQVAAAPQSTYVLFADQLRDRAFAAVLDERDMAYDRSEVGRFAVYRLRAKAPPSEFPAVWRRPL
jgi:hypothetical protein